MLNRGQASTVPTFRFILFYAEVDSVATVVLNRFINQNSIQLELISKKKVRFGIYIFFQ